MYHNIVQNWYKIWYTFTNVFFYHNVPYFPNVPNFYKLIFAPQCTTTWYKIWYTFTNVYLYHNVPQHGTKYGTHSIMYICTTMYRNMVPQHGTHSLMYIITRVNGVNLSCLSILNVPASTKQATFPLYSVALMMKKMMNLINFLLRLQQSKANKRNIWNNSFIYTHFAK